MKAAFFGICAIAALVLAFFVCMPVPTEEDFALLLGLAALCVLAFGIFLGIPIGGWLERRAWRQSRHRAAAAEQRMLARFAEPPAPPLRDPWSQLTVERESADEAAQQGEGGVL